MGSHTLTYSTELMENYLQASTMAPDRLFQALQKPDGQTLLFSVGQNGSFNVIAEVAGLPHGWAPTVSLNQQQPNTKCSTFGAAQRADGSIRVAMVLQPLSGAKTSDTLYVADLTLAADGTVKQPAWSSFVYDDPKVQRPLVTIAGVRVSEATDAEYVVVDVLRNPDQPSSAIVRYFVDPTKPDGHAWQLHDVTIDINSTDYATVLGRRGGTGVDGLYVGGQIGGSPQLAYSPLRNELRPGKRPLVDFLKLTEAGDKVPAALAACRLADGSTDLYAASDGVLYRFAADNQSNDAVAKVVLSDALFGQVSDLHAITEGDDVVVWGRNADAQVFYTSCPVASLGKGAWSFPLPLQQGVQHVSSFINRANGANTIVAHTSAEGLRIGAKSPETGLWTWRSVNLPPAEVTQPAAKYTSYTTRIDLADDKNQVAPGVPLAITAQSVTGVYVNHLYYVIGPRPTHIPTDHTGTVTLVESIPRLTGTRFTAQIADGDAPPQSVNPMDKAFRKATDLQTVKKLQDAQIVRYVDGKPVTTSLLKKNVDVGTLQQVAALNKQCSAVYDDPKKAPTKKLMAALAAAPSDPFVVPDNAPVVDSGDLFQSLEAHATHQRRLAAVNGTAVGAEGVGESFWEMLIRWFEGAWEFVVKIGEAIYRCILAVIEDVVSAIRWVFDKIVEAIEDLIDFLKYLFTWDDFKRTKDVVKNVVLVHLNHQVDVIASGRTTLDTMIEGLIADIDKWAGIDDHLSKLGPQAAGGLSTNASKDKPDAAGSLLSHHVQGNAAQGTTSDQSSAAPAQGPMQVLNDVLAAQSKTLGEAGRQLNDLVKAAPGMTLGQILKTVVGIIGTAALRSAKAVMDALIDLLVMLLRAAIEALDAPIHIPVISDILNAIGIPDFSVLDLLCWVTAVPVTIGYKIATAIEGNPRAPFPDCPETTFLATVSDFTSLETAFRPKALRTVSANSSTEVQVGGIIPELPLYWRTTVSVTLHSIAGVAGWLSAFVDAFESLIPTLEVPKLLSFITIASAIVGGGSRAAGNLLVPHDSLNNSDGNIASRFFIALFLANKIAWGAAGLNDKVSAKVDTRAWGAGIDAVLVIPALAITIVHFVELAEDPAGKDRTMAVMDEVSYLCTYVGRVLYTLIVTGAVGQNPEVKAGVATAMGITSIIHGAIQFSVAAVEANED